MGAVIRSETPPMSLSADAMLSVEVGQLVEHTLRYRLKPYHCIGVLQHQPMQPTELRKRYLQLARRLHPDKNGHPQAQEAFRVMCEAFRQVARICKASTFFRQTFADVGL